MSLKYEPAPAADQQGAAGGGSGGVQDEIRKLKEEYVAAGGRDPSMLEAPPLFITLTPRVE